MEISKVIKTMRRETGMSQSKFSEHFGISVRTLQQWEQGKSAPPEYVIRMMAYILSIEKITVHHEEQL